ncbi:Fructose-6-phosphate 2-kinase/fructose-2, partial [Rasamsonia emersonii CBS 393.64]
SADFFDPDNKRAVQLRERVALETLDELLDYILEQGGSVGILDATNSTLERRKAIMDHIRKRAGPELGVLFLESRCVDPVLLESNMRLKLSGPDYKDQDPVKALEDFKKRVALYEKSYVPLGEYEEQHNMPYVQMIDVGRKVVAHQTNGFLSSQVVYYLLNFNLSPRQIWITRHGESIDNQLGRIGGDSELSENGHRYAKALARFIDDQRKRWEAHQKQKEMSHFPPHPGDSTPPNPAYGPRDRPRNFCVWSSMMVRAIQTTQYFNEDDYDIKQMRMLDELYAGRMEGMTYDEIKEKFPEEYEHRKREKLQYRYPGPGGEGYLDVINRLRAVIIEVERMTDHVLLVGHRSVARVLLAYFLGLDRDQVAGLDVPLGVLYMLEPKPYGVDFKVYRYNPDTDWFDYLPDFKLHQASPLQ